MNFILKVLFRKRFENLLKYFEKTIFLVATAWVWLLLSAWVWFSDNFGGDDWWSQ
jgi:hypothetical protein